MNKSKEERDLIVGDGAWDLTAWQKVIISNHTDTVVPTKSYGLRFNRIHTDNT